jgi:hypothetical protein
MLDQLADELVEYVIEFLVKCSDLLSLSLVVSKVDAVRLRAY